MSSFVGYVGDPDFHDGSIVTVEKRDDTVRVRVRGFSGKSFLVSFTGVRAVRASEPEGMMLYSLTEFSCERPTRRFVFANWDDDSKAYLQVDALDFSVLAE